MNGNLSFYGTTGSVTNNGVINSSGDAVLVGTVAVNTGTITAPDGTTSIVSGTRLVLIPENGPSGILISPSSLPGNVTNSGVIKAASVYLSSSGGDVYALAGNNGGLIEATGTKTINGQVWLTAPTGTISVSSPITASNSDGSGGTILIDGLNNVINSNSILNASGFGGVINIGLFPSLPESLSTTLSSGATLLAGGINGGGFIDTSGDTLNIGNITVNANGGTWLLDPEDITIDSSNVGSVNKALTNGNVILDTEYGIASSSPTILNSVSSGSGNINIDAPISWDSGMGDNFFVGNSLYLYKFGHALDINAYNSININSTITVSGGGTLYLDYDLEYGESNLTLNSGTLNIPGKLQFTDSYLGVGQGFVTGEMPDFFVSHSYPSVTPPNNNPKNVQPAPSMSTANPWTSHETYALTHNKNVMKCHSTLSSKPIRKLVKEIVKGAGKVAGKVGVKLFNKSINKITGLEWAIPKFVLKKALLNNRKST